ncbi:MAG TPA: hypothetical protein ENN47_10350 [Mesotoga infera]|uniref:Cyclase family protein n=1 Tax=Mesotoga infera TaxID=1236046 RepID=A0A7C1GUB2_9BACT|nr:hypothetical protein [Mesotoga infera]
MDDVLSLPGVSIKWRSKFGDGKGKSNQTSIIEIFAHHGTHIDAPSHVHEDGLLMSDFDASDFILNRPLFIVCPKGDREKINHEDLELFRDELEDSDCLLVYTGFSKYRHDRRRFVENSPSFSEDSLEYLLGNFPKIRCLGMDIFSIENIPEGRSFGWLVHKSYLKAREKRFAIEDMKLEPLIGKTLNRVISIPLLLDNEACPATVVAEVDDPCDKSKGGN